MIFDDGNTGERQGGSKAAKLHEKRSKTAIPHRNLPKYRNRGYECAR